MIESVEFTAELALHHVIYSFVHKLLEFNLICSTVSRVDSSSCDGFQVTVWNTTVLQTSQLHQATRQLSVHVYTDVGDPHNSSTMCVCVAIQGCSVHCTASPKPVTFGHTHLKIKL